jgi:hypothetical protein
LFDQIRWTAEFSTPPNRRSAFILDVHHNDGVRIDELKFNDRACQQGQIIFIPPGISVMGEQHDDGQKQIGHHNYFPNEK